MSLKSKLMEALGHSILLVEGTLRPAQKISIVNVHSILILEYLLPLGCCVHLTPLYESIKQSRPEIILTVATRGLAAKLLRHNPHIDHLIQTPDALTETVTTARVLRAELSGRNLRPDLTLTGSSDRRSRIALLGLLTSPARRAGFTLVPQLYHQPLAYDPNLSLIDNNLRLAPEAGCSSVHREPTVFFSRNDHTTALTLAAEVTSTGKPLLIMVTQPSGGQSTGWHQERFAEVAQYAVSRLGCAVAFVGTAMDFIAIEALRLAAGGVGTNLAGRTSITELAALLALSDYLVSLDTGTMHLGRAVGLPLIVLAPSWQKPLEWLPINVPSARIIRGPDRSEVSRGYKLDEITMMTVITALRELMDSFPQSAHARASRVNCCLSEVDHYSGK